MFGPKIKLSKALHAKIKEAAFVSGSSSVEEFAQSVLEAEADKILNHASKTGGVSKEEVDQISKKLKGLGYLE